MSASYLEGAYWRSIDLTCWDGTVELPLDSMGIVPYGYGSIAEMLAATPFYIAHRGGSADWPEGSLLAYTRAVAWGAPALEAPVARTSDGVWFVLHDEDMNRTSQTSGLPPASTMTWAQVQAYRITLNGGDEPYLRLDDLLGIYSGSHVFFVDPKHSAGDAAELFALLKTFPDWDKHVIKFFYSATTLAADAKAEGFTTWGFYYEEDAAQIASTHTNWDLLGMNYSASQSAWDLALAHSKPVIGHIVPDAASASAALGKGASGVMASGVMDVVPYRGEAV